MSTLSEFPSLSAQLAAKNTVSITPSKGVQKPRQSKIPRKSPPSEAIKSEDSSLSQPKSPNLKGNTVASVSNEEVSRNGRPGMGIHADMNYYSPSNSSVNSISSIHSVSSTSSKANAAEMFSSSNAIATENTTTLIEGENEEESEDYISPQEEIADPSAVEEEVEVESGEVLKLRPEVSFASPMRMQTVGGSPADPDNSDDSEDSDPSDADESGVPEFVDKLPKDDGAEKKEKEKPYFPDDKSADDSEANIDMSEELGLSQQMTHPKLDVGALDEFESVNLDDGTLALPMNQILRTPITSPVAVDIRTVPSQPPAATSQNLQVSPQVPREEGVAVQEYPNRGPPRSQLMYDTDEQVVPGIQDEKDLVDDDEMMITYLFKQFRHLLSSSSTTSPQGRQAASGDSGSAPVGPVPDGTAAEVPVGSTADNPGAHLDINLNSNAGANIGRHRRKY